jgi:hypothetical protein
MLDSDLTTRAANLCQELNQTLDSDQRIGYLDLLDALATAGLTLTADETKEASRAYATAVEMEGLWAA